MSAPAEVMTGVRELLGLVTDFPFASEVDRTVWLSGVLTLMNRDRIPGPTPMFLVEGPAGSGKSLLVKLAGLLATGRIPVPFAQAQNNYAERKRLMEIRLEAGLRKTPVSLYWIDNINRPFGTEALEESLYLSRCGYYDVYGHAANIDNRVVIWGTGRNVEYAKGYDGVYRKTLRIRLTERSQKNFAVPVQLQQLAKQHDQAAFYQRTGRMLVELWQESGFRPDLPPWDVYEAWSAVIRSTLVWLGMPDPFVWRGKGVGRQRESMLRKAQFLKAEKGLTETAALDELAHTQGFQDWNELTEKTHLTQPDPVP